MHPILLHLVVPAGLGKLVALAVLVIGLVGRAAARLREARRADESLSVVAAFRADWMTSAALAGAALVLWRAGVLDREIRLPLHSYGVLIAAAFMAGLWLAQREARRRGQDAERLADLAFWVLVAALVGSRVYFILVNRGEFFGAGSWLVATPIGRIPRVLAFWEGGLVFYGGFIGATLAALLYMRRHRLPFLAYADTIIPSVAFGHFLGRLGCFFAGCCWGGLAPRDLPWAARFPPESMAYQTFLDRPEPGQLPRARRRDDATAPPDPALRGARRARAVRPARLPRPAQEALSRAGARDLAPRLRGAAHGRRALPRRPRARRVPRPGRRSVDLVPDLLGGRGGVGECPQGAPCARRRGCAVARR